MEVRLNVYDLPGSESSNAFLYNMGMGGLFHTGVEVQTSTASSNSSFELSYSNNGIQRTPPRLPAFGNLRTQVVLGTAPSISQINFITAELSQREFAPGTYHLTSHNCNHFTEAFSQALFNRGIPSYINRAAAAASTVVSQQPSPTTTDRVLAAPGTVRPPKEIRTVAEEVKEKSSGVSAASSLFSFFTSSNHSSSDSNIENEHKGAKPTEHKQLSDKQKVLLAKLKK